jgi:hypothetical protein
LPRCLAVPSSQTIERYDKPWVTRRVRQSCLDLIEVLHQDSAAGLQHVRDLAEHCLALRQMRDDQTGRAPVRSPRDTLSMMQLALLHCRTVGKPAIVGREFNLVALVQWRRSGPDARGWRTVVGGGREIPAMYVQAMAGTPAPEPQHHPRP